jgi:hypothetical protein
VNFIHIPKFEILGRDIINPPPSCLLIFMDQKVRSMLLKMMPTLDDINVTVWQVGDTSWGMRIPGTDAANNQGGADTSSDSNKGKGKVAASRSMPKEGSCSPSRDAEESSRQTAPPEKKRRLIRNDGSSVTEPAS